MTTKLRALKQEFPPADYRKVKGWDIAAIYSKGRRAIIAADLRSFRRAAAPTPGSAEAAYQQAALRCAVVSTATRNFLKGR